MGLWESVLRFLFCLTGLFVNVLGIHWFNYSDFVCVVIPGEANPPLIFPNKLHYQLESSLLCLLAFRLIFKLI